MRGYKMVQILNMLRCHLPVSVIAKRMKVSERTVQRLIDVQGVNWVVHYRDRAKVRRVSRLIKEGREAELWATYHATGLGYERIGYLFGRSKQAIQQALLKTNLL